MAREGNDSYRHCIDFRKVNEISKKDAYLKSFMIGILDTLSMA